MAKFFIVIAILIAAAVFLLSRDGKAEAVSECIEKAGATVEESPVFQELFPYLMAIGENARVRSFPELEDSTVYGVKYGGGEALLFIGDDGEDARSFEQTLVDFGAAEGVEIPSRRADNVLLIWTVSIAPLAASPIDHCIEEA